MNDITQLTFLVFANYSLFGAYHAILYEQTKMLCTSWKLVDIGTHGTWTLSSSMIVSQFWWYTIKLLPVILYKNVTRSKRWKHTSHIWIYLVRSLIFYQPIIKNHRIVKAKLFEVRTQHGALSTTMLDIKFSCVDNDNFGYCLNNLMSLEDMNFNLYFCK